ncbi:hypothetical protein ONZ45_g14303 [Pleurotus djamor]|nr:hypothetical protein ONZ45_g14303 [Pleurotus djamor]
MILSSVPVLLAIFAFTSYVLADDSTPAVQLVSSTKLKPLIIRPANPRGGTDALTTRSDNPLSGLLVVAAVMPEIIVPSTAQATVAAAPMEKYAVDAQAQANAPVLGSSDVLERISAAPLAILASVIALAKVDVGPVAAAAAAVQPPQ